MTTFTHTMLRAFLWSGSLCLVACESGTPDPSPSVEPAAAPDVNDGGDVEDAGVVGDAGVVAEGWHTLQALPVARQETACVVHDGEVWVVGGYGASPGAQMVDTVHIYNPDDDSWREGPRLPEPLHHAQVAAVGDDVLVLGYLVSGFRPSGNAYKLNAAGTGWDPIASMPAGAERGAGIAVVLDDEVWVVGGFQYPAAIASVWRYQPDDDTWVAGPALPEALDHLVAGVVDGRIVTAGGRAVSIGAHNPHTFVLNADKTAWLRDDDMPTSRAGAAAAVLDDMLVVFGGEGAPNATGVFNNVEGFTLDDGWMSFEPMAVPRHGFCAAALPNSIFLPGGADVEAFAAIDHVDHWVPPQ